MNIFTKISILLFGFNLAFADFAIVDMKKIEEESIVTKKLAEDISKVVSELEQDVIKIRDEMEKKVADLQKIAPTLSQDAVEKRRNDLQQEFMSLDSSFQERDSKIQDARVKALEEINNKIRDISETIAKKKDYDLVLPSSFAIYYNTKNDITKDVISALNAELKSVKFEVETKNKAKNKK